MSQATETIDVEERAESFFERFEQLRIPPGAFGHRDHMEAAYEMLRKYSFLEATSRYARTIQTMARRAGAEKKFHVTITLAFMSLIAERMESTDHRDFETFSRVNEDLFARDVLDRLYSRERLHSDVARRIFVMPDSAR